MRLIVGLGNPGKIYENTRHNIGFSVIEALGKVCRVSFKRDNSAFCLSAKYNIDNHPVVSAMPLTFMNLSGFAVAALLKKYKISLENLLVVLDDIDLGFGRIKVKPSGSSAGHRGMQSIIECLKSEKFARLRIGIGQPYAGQEASQYVLSPFSKSEKEQLKQIMAEATACIRVWVNEGINRSMNIYNSTHKETVVKRSKE